MTLFWKYGSYIWRCNSWGNYFKLCKSTFHCAKLPFFWATLSGKLRREHFGVSGWDTGIHTGPLSVAVQLHKHMSPFLHLCSADSATCVSGKFKGTLSIAASSTNSLTFWTLPCREVMPEFSLQIIHCVTCRHFNIDLVVPVQKLFIMVGHIWLKLVISYYS